MDRLYRKIAKASVWRDTIPSEPTSYVVNQLVPGQQLDITDMRIRFRVDRAIVRTPDQCDLQITNLEQSVRQDLTTRPLSVQLDAGYDDVARLLFVGDLHFGMSKIEGPNWTTLLQCGDGDRAYNYARVRRSYGAGTTVRTVLKDVAASMGVQLPANLGSDSTLDTQVLSGMAVHGPARDKLTHLLAPFGYHWTVQHGQLRVLRDDEVSSEFAIPIDQDHGMIGSPEYGSPPKSGKPPHVRVKMELYPEIMPGDLVQVTSEAIVAGQGLFRVEKVRHQGDTHAHQWDTTIEIQPF